jgi:galactosamine-6-phosphate isomerase
MIEPHILENHEAMSQAAADWLFTRILDKPDSLLCLATGATPMRAYELLALNRREHFNRVRVLKLDEWFGIPMRSPATCESFLRRAVIDPLQLSSRYTSFNSLAPNPITECARIAEWLDDNGPIDLCVLGLGINGHLGFNEPANALNPHAHVAKLSTDSLSHSMIAEEPIKPTAGLTLGMADLLQSREILLVVSGPTKRAPLERLLSSAITPQFPATFLQLHPRVSLFCDAAAGQSVSQP